MPPGTSIPVPEQYPQGMQYAETQTRQINDGQRHFNQIRYTVGIIWIVIKQVIAKGAKS